MYEELPRQTEALFSLSNKLSEHEDPFVTLSKRGGLFNMLSKCFV